MKKDINTIRSRLASNNTSVTKEISPECSVFIAFDKTFTLKYKYVIKTKNIIAKPRIANLKTIVIAVEAPIIFSYLTNYFSL